MSNDNGEVGRGQPAVDPVAVDPVAVDPVAVDPVAEVDKEDKEEAVSVNIPVDAATEAAKAAAADLDEANAAALAEDEARIAGLKSPEPNLKPSKVKDLQDRFAKNRKKPEPDKPHAGGNSHVAALDEGAHKFAKTMEAFRELGRNKDLREMAYDAFHQLLAGVTGPPKKSHTGLDAREEMLAQKAAEAAAKPAVANPAAEAAKPHTHDAAGNDVIVEDNENVPLDNIGTLNPRGLEDVQKDVELVKPSPQGSNDEHPDATAAAADATATAERTTNMTR